MESPVTGPDIPSGRIPICNKPDREIKGRETFSGSPVTDGNGKTAGLALHGVISRLRCYD